MKKQSEVFEVRENASGQAKSASKTECSQTLWGAFGSTAARATRAKKEVLLRVKWELNEKTKRSV